jgi:hypothetical protein
MRYLFEFSRRGFWLRLLIALLCSAAYFAGTSSVVLGSSNQSAAGESIFSLQPVAYDPSNPVTRSYFVINADQGALLQQQVRVTNVGTATGTVKLFSVDATTSQMGGIVYLSPKQAQHDVGTWITLGTQQLTLAPAQSQVVQFQVAIPQKVGSGQHVGGIVAQKTTLQNSTTSLGQTHIRVNVQEQTAIAVEVIVPGSQTEQLVATGIQAAGGSGHQQLLVGLKNTGNVMIKAFGSLQVSDAQGHLLQNLTMHVETFLPRTSIYYPASVQNKAIGDGTYQGVLTLTYGRNSVFDHILHYATTFTITQQQVKQVFPNRPLQAPPLATSFLPLWAIILITVLAILVVSGASGLLFWRLGMRAARGSRRRSQGEHGQT